MTLPFLGPVPLLHQPPHETLFPWNASMLPLNFQCVSLRRVWLHLISCPLWAVERSSKVFLSFLFFNSLSLPLLDLCTSPRWRAQFISDSPLDLGDPKLNMTFQMLLCEHQVEGEKEDLVPDDFTQPNFLKLLNTYEMLQLNLLFLKPVFFPSPYTSNMAKNCNWNKFESWYLRAPVAKEQCMWQEKAHNTRIIFPLIFYFPKGVRNI